MHFIEKGKRGMIGVWMFAHGNSYFSFLLCSHTVNSNRTLLWGFPQLTNDNKPENGGKTNGMMDWRTKRRKIRRAKRRISFPENETSIFSILTSTNPWNICKWNYCLILDNSSLKVYFPLLRTLCLKELSDKNIVQTNWPLAFEHQY